MVFGHARRLRAFGKHSGMELGFDYFANEKGMDDQRFIFILACNIRFIYWSKEKS